VFNEQKVQTSFCQSDTPLAVVGGVLAVSLVLGGLANLDSIGNGVVEGAKAIPGALEDGAGAIAALPGELVEGVQALPDAIRSINVPDADNIYLNQFQEHLLGINDPKGCVAAYKRADLDMIEGDTSVEGTKATATDYKAKSDHSKVADACFKEAKETQAKTAGYVNSFISYVNQDPPMEPPKPAGDGPTCKQLASTAMCNDLFFKQAASLAVAAAAAGGPAGVVGGVAAGVGAITVKIFCLRVQMEKDAITEAEDYRKAVLALSNTAAALKTSWDIVDAHTHSLQTLGQINDDPDMQRISAALGTIGIKEALAEATAMLDGKFGKLKRPSDFASRNVRNEASTAFGDNLYHSVPVYALAAQMYPAPFGLDQSATCPKDETHTLKPTGAKCFQPPFQGPSENYNIQAGLLQAQNVAVTDFEQCITEATGVRSIRGFNSATPQCNRHTNYVAE
jgi:hypothetical protein